MAYAPFGRYDSKTTRAFSVIPGAGVLTRDQQRLNSRIADCEHAQNVLRVVSQAKEDGVEVHALNFHHACARVASVGSPLYFLEMVRDERVVDFLAFLRNSLHGRPSEFSLDILVGIASHFSRMGLVKGRWADHGPWCTDQLPLVPLPFSSEATRYSPRVRVAQAQPLRPLSGHSPSAPGNASSPGANYLMGASAGMLAPPASHGLAETPDVRQNGSHAAWTANEDASLRSVEAMDPSWFIFRALYDRLAAAAAAAARDADSGAARQQTPSCPHLLTRAALTVAEGTGVLPQSFVLMVRHLADNAVTTARRVPEPSDRWDPSGPWLSQGFGGMPSDGTGEPRLGRVSAGSPLGGIPLDARSNPALANGADDSNRTWETTPRAGDWPVGRHGIVPCVTTMEAHAREHVYDRISFATPVALPWSSAANLLVALHTVASRSHRRGDVDGILRPTGLFGFPTTGPFAVASLLELLASRDSVLHALATRTWGEGVRAEENAGGAATVRARGIKARGASKAGSCTATHTSSTASASTAVRPLGWMGAAMSKLDRDATGGLALASVTPGQLSQVALCCANGGQPSRDAHAVLALVQGMLSRWGGDDVSDGMGSTSPRHLGGSHSSAAGSGGGGVVGVTTTEDSRHHGGMSAKEERASVGVSSKSRSSGGSAGLATALAALTWHELGDLLLAYAVAGWGLGGHGGGYHDPLGYWPQLFEQGLEMLFPTRSAPASLSSLALASSSPAPPASLYLVPSSAGAGRRPTWTPAAAMAAAPTRLEDASAVRGSLRQIPSRNLARIAYALVRGGDHLTRGHKQEMERELAERGTWSAVNLPLVRDDRGEGAAAGGLGLLGSGWVNQGKGFLDGRGAAPLWIPTGVEGEVYGAAGHSTRSAPVATPVPLSLSRVNRGRGKPRTSSPDADTMAGQAQAAGGQTSGRNVNWQHNDALGLSELGYLARAMLGVGSRALYAGIEARALALLAQEGMPADAGMDASLVRDIASRSQDDTGGHALRASGAVDTGVGGSDRGGGGGSGQVAVLELAGPWAATDLALSLAASGHARRDPGGFIPRLVREMAGDLAACYQASVWRSTEEASGLPPWPSYSLVPSPDGRMGLEPWQRIDLLWSWLVWDAVLRPSAEAGSQHGVALPFPTHGAGQWQKAWQQDQHLLRTGLLGGTDASSGTGHGSFAVANTGQAARLSQGDDLMGSSRGVPSRYAHRGGSNPLREQTPAMADARMQGIVDASISAIERMPATKTVNGVERSRLVCDPWLLAVVTALAHDDSLAGHLNGACVVPHLHRLIQVAVACKPPAIATPAVQPNQAGEEEESQNAAGASPGHGPPFELPDLLASATCRLQEARRTALRRERLLQPHAHPSLLTWRASSAPPGLVSGVVAAMPVGMPLAAGMMLPPPPQTLFPANADKHITHAEARHPGVVAVAGQGPPDFQPGRPPPVRSPGLHPPLVSRALLDGNGNKGSGSPSLGLTFLMEVVEILASLGLPGHVNRDQVAALQGVLGRKLESEWSADDKPQGKALSPPEAFLGAVPVDIAITHGSLLFEGLPLTRWWQAAGVKRGIAVQTHVAPRDYLSSDVTEFDPKAPTYGSWPGAIFASHRPRASTMEGKGFKGQLAPSVVLAQRLLAEEGWLVVEVAHSDWTNLRSEFEKKSFLRHLIKSNLQEASVRSTTF